MTGNNCFWNFSNMTPKIPKQTIRYLIIEDTLKVFADNSIYKYKNTSIGLLLLSTENPKTWQTYITCPPIMIPFALHIGDSIISTYQSTGNYCNDYSIKSQGTIVAKCIGIGKLKDSDNEILDNIYYFIAIIFLLYTLRLKTNKKEIRIYPILRKRKKHTFGQIQRHMKFCINTKYKNFQLAIFNFHVSISFINMNTRL